ncbi:MAG: hypothetical protein DWI02_04540 [Planctomycetota bacterium]|nr:MAG: hypothetical protein DWI02_04540 [Planctomycetota bacterium]
MLLTLSISLTLSTLIYLIEGVVMGNRPIRILCAVGALILAWELSVINALQPSSTFARDQADDPADENRQEESGGMRRPLTEDEMVEQRRQELLFDFNDPPSLDHGESVHPRLMQTVKDNTIGVRYEEREAYLRVLRLASEVPLRRQEQFAAEIRTERRTLNPSYKRRRPDEFPQFADLFTHPEFYRGRPVTLRGVMRKLTKFELGKNKLGLDEAYEGWVYTSDSQGNPAVVIFTSKDDQLPVNGDIQEEVEFTGYYFKMYGYDAQDVTRKAPMLLAGEVKWIPHPYKSAYKPLGFMWYFLATLGFLLTGYLVWQANRKELPRRPPLEIEPDFRHFPPMEHPAPSPLLPRSMTETEDS